MAWEVRGGRRYLYRSERVGGRVVRRYLARDVDLAAALEAQWQDERAEREAARRFARAERHAEQRGLVALLRLAAGAAERDAAESLMVLAGFRRHNRGEWRMAGPFAGLFRKGDDGGAEARPLLLFTPGADAEAAALLKAARAGDAAAVAKLPALLRDRRWADRMGSLGEQAAREFVDAAAAGDPVFVAAVGEKSKALFRQVAGDTPTVLERLLARRVVNGWLAVHLTEIELARAKDLGRRAKLEALVGKAERRMASAARELAVVRRLQAPALLARIEVAAAARPELTSGA